MIRLEEVSFEYGDKSILEEYSLQLYSGKYQVLGENGAGKTTLFKLICGELTSYSGTVEVNGREVQNINNQEMYDCLISYARQEDEFIDNLTVKENLEMYNVDYLDDQVQYLMKLFDVELLVDKCVSSLSGGERKKFQLIRTFSSKANIILLDEPDNHLDDESITVLKSLINKSSKLILVISHSTLLGELTLIRLNCNFIQVSDEPESEMEKIAKKLPRLKMPNSYLWLLVIWLIITSIIILYYSYDINYIDSFFSDSMSTESFADDNSIYLKAPVNNSYASLFKTEDWFEKIPAYFNQQFIDELKTTDGVETVIPVRNYDVLDSCIYEENDVYYQDKDNSIYDLPASVNVISNTNLYGSIESQIKGNLPRDNQREILITQEYAHRYKMELGDYVSISATQSSGEQLKFKYKVVGIYKPKNLDANFISYDDTIEEQNIFDLNNNLEYRANKLAEVEANSNQTSLLEQLEGEKQYEMLYVKLDSEKDLQKLAKQLYDYDPYIEVVSSVNLESNYINSYKFEKLKDLVIDCCKVIILMLILVIIIAKLIVYKFCDNYIDKLTYAGYLCADVRTILKMYSKPINTVLIALIAITFILACIFRVWIVLWICVLLVIALKVILVLLIQGKRSNFAIKN